jgi:chemosensory pili system protein ChpA (sensor histidine kinase/response regulator)
MKEERVHPADLWLDELQMLPGIVLPTLSASAVTRAPALRGGVAARCACPRRARHVHAARGLAAAATALDEVRNHEQEARRATDTPDRGIWHALAMVFRALAQGLLPSDLLAKRFAARAHLLVRQYLQGQVRVPQALLNDAIFFLVSTGLTPTAPRTRAARRAGRRAGAARRYRAQPARSASTRRMWWRAPTIASATTAGSIHRHAQSANAAAAIERAAGDDQAGWELALASLAEAAMPLAQPALEQCLTAVAAHAGRRPPHDALGRAGVALFLSQALAMPWRVHGKSGHASAPNSRSAAMRWLSAWPIPMPRRPPGWPMVEAASAQAQRAEAVAQLRAQLDSGESWLDTYDRNAARPDASEALDDARQAFESLLATLERVYVSAAMPDGIDEAAMRRWQRCGPCCNGWKCCAEPSRKRRASRCCPISPPSLVPCMPLPICWNSDRQGRCHEDDIYADLQHRDPAPQGVLARVARPWTRSAWRRADSPEIQRLRGALQAVRPGRHRRRCRAAAPGQRSHHATPCMAGRQRFGGRTHGRGAGRSTAGDGCRTGSHRGAGRRADAGGCRSDRRRAARDLPVRGRRGARQYRRRRAGRARCAARCRCAEPRASRFHTLKGSSRMVGLNRYGEAAWAVEQVMNLWIAEAREPQPELLALLHQAHDLLREWALALQQDPSTLREIATRCRRRARARSDSAPPTLAAAVDATAPLDRSMRC